MNERIFMSLTKQASLTKVPFLADWPMAQNMCFSIECRFLVFQSVSSLQSSFETTSTCVLSRLRGVTLVEKFVLPQPAMVKLFPSSFVSGNLYSINTYWVNRCGSKNSLQPLQQQNLPFKGKHAGLMDWENDTLLFSLTRPMSWWLFL